VSKILDDLEELIQAGIISEDNAVGIREYYQAKDQGSPNRLFLIFGLLGAILVGLGIILIIAHNWDNFSQTTKTIFAFIPLIIGQAICAYSLIKIPENQTWREAGATFTFFAIGGCISLVSQIYHIQGNTSDFLLTWMLLALPLVYVMNSAMSSLLYILGFSYYAMELGYFDYPTKKPYLYLVMLASIIPFFLKLRYYNPKSNFVGFHNVFFVISATIVLGTFTNKEFSLILINYLAIFSLFYLVGFFYQDSGSSAYNIVGAIGALSILISLSFDDIWESLAKASFDWPQSLQGPEFWFLLILSAAIFYLLSLLYLRKQLEIYRPLVWIFPIILPIYFIGFQSPGMYIFINLIVLAIGVLTILRGNRENNLRTLNFGLVIISALVIFRFFDSDIPFTIRGILFLLLGVGFFVANYRMLRMKNSQSENPNP
jgi:uncharacterized membrane protein